MMRICKILSKFFNVHGQAAKITPEAEEKKAPLFV